MTLRVAAVFLVTLAAACASPSPSPTPIPSATGTAPPTVAPSPTPSLHVGGLARVVASFTPELGPGDAPSPEHGPVAVKSGDIVYLIEGPRSDGVRTLWRVLDNAYWPMALGWVPERDTADATLLEPYAANCPDGNTTISANAVGAIGQAQALSCFGGATISLDADLLCSQAVGDGPYFLTGAPWLEGGSGILCLAGTQPNDFTVFGRPLTELTKSNSYQFIGRAMLTGHYDDPAAANCRWAPGNYAYVPLDQAYEASAVMSCRLNFIVTAVEELTNR